MMFRSVLCLSVFACAVLTFCRVVDASRTKHDNVKPGHVGEVNNIAKALYHKRTIPVTPRRASAYAPSSRTKPFRYMFLNHNRKYYTACPNDVLESPSSNHDLGNTDQQVEATVSPVVETTEEDEENFHSVKSRIDGLKKKMAALRHTVNEEPGRSPEIRQLEHQQKIEEVVGARALLDARIDALQKRRQSILDKVARLNAARAEVDKKAKAGEESTEGMSQATHVVS